MILKATIFVKKTKLKFWHAKKIDLEKSFPTSPNMNYFVSVNVEINAFRIGPLSNIYYCEIK